MEELQKQLDERKWRESKILGQDMCGKYVYCIVCNKNDKYPCAEAKTRFENKGTKHKKKAKAKFNVNGKELNYRATIVEK